jgi:protocatechuate 3,4-dioxygenase beta subunit
VDFGVVPPAATPALTVGNTVFRDANNNGTQDGTESGIAGVTVELLDASGSNVLKTTTTSPTGNYTFSGLAAGTYRVRLPAANFNSGGVLFGFTPSPTAVSDPNNDTDKDSNGNLSGTLGQGGFVMSGPIALVLDHEPDNDGDTDKNTNLTLDFGLVPPTGTLTLGNLVFNDANGNGVFDTLETGISGVTVQLLNTQGAVLQTTTTAAGGLYTFAGLVPGDYKVRLSSANFNPGGVLANFAPSGTPSADPDDNANNVNDGSAVGQLGSGGFVESGVITLTANGETGNDGDTDNNTNLSLDFGLAVKTANRLTLGDRVFKDANNNGRLDSGETGIANVTVQLISSTGTVLKTVTTDTDGKYAFDSLTAGDYKVRLPATDFQTSGPLAGFTPSATGSSNPNDNVNDDNDGAATGSLGTTGTVDSGLVTLSANGEPTTDGDADKNTNLSLDFAMVQAAAGTLSLGGTVWNDTNNNGLLDASEGGIAGVLVQLLNVSGTVVQTATTGAGGTFSFTALTAGDYKVRLPASDFTGTAALVGFTSSTGTNGSPTGAFEGSATPDPDTGTDSDDNGLVTGTLGTTSGLVETKTLSLATSTTTVDLGMFRKLSLGNVVFNDLNNNGTQDANEPGIGNVSVRLLNADASFALVATTTTNAQGQYLFTNLVPGNYAVDLADTNFRAGGVLFGFQSSTGASNAFEPAPATATDKQDHGTATGPLGSGGSVQSRTIALSATGPTGENPNTDPNTPDAQNDLTVDFGLFQQNPETASIAGRVFLDFNNNGSANGPDSEISGVTLSLSGGGLSAPITVRSDAQGDFTFNNLAAGTYTLIETQPTSPANQTGKVTAGSAGGTVAAITNTIAGITLTAGKEATGYDFAEVPLVSTGGSVFEDSNGNGIKDTGEPGIAGATLTLTGTSIIDGTITPKTATTGSDGTYTFASLTPGTYTIAETQPTGFTDGKDANGTPAAKTVTNDKFAGIDLTTSPTSGAFNFGEVKGASLGGFVYDDANNDGSKAATGEAGIASVKLRLTGTDDQGHAVDETTTTGTDGSYLFGSLRPGTYRVAETQPAGFADGKETTGTPAGNAATNDQISGIALTSGTAATGFLFGEQARADLKLTQSPGVASINPGGTVTITYTLKNVGTATATAATVAMNFGKLTFVSASVPAEFNATTKTWTTGDLAAGETKTIQLTLRGPVAGTYTPSAHATTTATELSATNNSASSTISAGMPAPPVETPSRSVARGFLARINWFLSSSTNARRSRR